MSVVLEAFALTGWWLPLILALFVSVACISLLLSISFEFALDVPNHRSLHSIPVPRTGGWALIAGALVGLVVSPLAINPGIAVAFLLLMGVSALDDMWNLSARLRFCVHIGSISLLLLALPEPQPWWCYPILLLSGVWVINLYNFMDGMDGLAGSMAVSGFAALGLVSAWRGYGELAGICGLLVACSLVFLRYNWPPARIFLGDVGSTVLGLAVVAISLFGWQQGAFSWSLPIVAFAPFWLDASITLLRRVFAGERWWEAHRDHWYQRMALRHGVRTALCVEIALMALSLIVAVSLAGVGLA